LIVEYLPTGRQVEHFPEKGREFSIFNVQFSIIIFMHLPGKKHMALTDAQTTDY
jgi:hypothetical protein